MRGFYVFIYWLSVVMVGVGVAYVWVGEYGQAYYLALWIFCAVMYRSSLEEDRKEEAEMRQFLSDYGGLSSLERKVLAKDPTFFFRYNFKRPR